MPGFRDLPFCLGFCQPREGLGQCLPGEGEAGVLVLFHCSVPCAALSALSPRPNHVPFIPGTGKRASFSR